LVSGVTKGKKAPMIEKFVKTYLSKADSEELFGFFRILMPHLDRERGNYNLKEQALAKIYS
jgi:hypothetical protein